MVYHHAYRIDACTQASLVSDAQQKLHLLVGSFGEIFNLIETGFHARSVFYSQTGSLCGKHIKLSKVARTHLRYVRAG